MRTEIEIIRAHDLLIQVMGGELPEITFPDEGDRDVAQSATNVLCWVLGHDSGFAETLARIRGVLDEAGYDLFRAPEEAGL